MHTAEQQLALSLTGLTGYSQGYLRQGAAYEGLQQYDRATAAYERALSLESSADSAQVAKLTSKVAQLRARSSKASASKSKAAVQRGFLSQPSASIYREKDDVVAKVVEANGTVRDEAPHERTWRTLLARLKQGCASSRGVNARGERVVLDDGVFAKLLDERAFQTLVYPGIPAHQRAHAPQNLQALLADPWYERELLALMPAVQAKAESVLTNVKARGAAQGEHMDAATEQQLWPQVLQEAFGREVLAMVHRVNAQKHVLLANDARTLADPSDTRALYDQLSGESLDALLGPSAATVIDGFMGDEWSALLLADAQRMAASNALMETPSHDAGRPTSTSSTSSSGRMRFLEPTECAKTYPALAELLNKLHALPFEINRKRSDAAALCAQFAHATALHQLRNGDAQAPRLDCGYGAQDNGVKLTCVYFVNAPRSHKEASPTLELRTSAAADAPVQRVAPIADRVVLFQSQRVVNEITRIDHADDELFYITFWIHGKALL